LRQAAKGLPRKAGITLDTRMHWVMIKALNHLPDGGIQPAIEKWL